MKPKPKPKPTDTSKLRLCRACSTPHHWDLSTDGPVKPPVVNTLTEEQDCPSRGKRSKVLVWDTIGSR